MTTVKDPAQHVRDRVLEQQDRALKEMEEQNRALRKLEEENREYAEQAANATTGRADPAFGPSDSSDSASDMPQDAGATDSDRYNTGERADVEDTVDDEIADDVAPDRIVDEDEAGLARTPPDPERNGGQG